jgi:hypothetical protein
MFWPSSSGLLQCFSKRHFGLLNGKPKLHASVLTGTRSREHITPVLRELHWLPIKHRINFKIVLITYKALNSLAPPYLADLLHHHAPSRFLRSSSANLLQVPRTKRRTWGDRAFSVAAPPFGIHSPPTSKSLQPSLLSNLHSKHTFLDKPSPPNSHLILHV